MAHYYYSNQNWQTSFSYWAMREGNIFCHADQIAVSPLIGLLKRRLCSKMNRWLSALGGFFVGIVNSLLGAGGGMYTGERGHSAHPPGGAGYIPKRVCRNSRLHSCRDAIAGNCRTPAIPARKNRLCPSSFPYTMPYYISPLKKSAIWYGISSCISPSEKPPEHGPERAAARHPQENRPFPVEKISRKAILQKIPRFHVSRRHETFIPFPPASP